MKKSTYLLFFLILFLNRNVQAQGQAPYGASDNTTLNNQIICGYQGWFAYPGDGAPINKWRHWFSGQSPVSDSLTVEMYPMMDEYDPADLEESLIPMNGGYAKFYSAYKRNVVMKHFEWMRDYGIAGVFHMRFLQDIDKPNNYAWKTKVLENVRAGAQRYGRVFAVSYNITGMDNTVFQLIRDDWKKLVDTLQITSYSRYLHHNGLPVLRIYGIGFDRGEKSLTDTQAMTDMINWFRNNAEEKYRVFLIGGVPAQWRTRTGDSQTDPAWENVYLSLDGIQPWHVGRWASITGFDNYYSNRIAADAAECASEGILYMPTMWPGFSWYNLKKGQQGQMNQIPREGGDFMWAQAYRYVNEGIKTIWMAQFDEVDEGTAIFKVAKNSSETPDQGQWLTLDADGDDLPNDWYLTLCGMAQQMLKACAPISSTIPIDPYDPMPQPQCPQNAQLLKPDVTENTAIPDDTGTQCSVYPNPFSSSVQIKSDRKIKRVSITDLRGNIVARFRVSDDEAAYDLSALNSGVYVVSVEHADGTVSLKRIIKI